MTRPWWWPRKRPAPPVAGLPPGHDHGPAIYDAVFTFHTPDGPVRYHSRGYPDGCYHLHGPDGQLIHANYPDAATLAALEHLLEDTP